MAIYRRASDGALHSADQIIAANPNSSAAVKPMTVEKLAALGYDPILEGSKPTPANRHEFVRRLAEPVEDGLGNWVWAYETVDKRTGMDTEEAAAYLAERQAECSEYAAKLLDPEPGALGTIDQQAEIERGRYTTLAWAQERVYEYKEAEAIAYQANNAVATSEIPYLTAEAASTGEAVATLAATYIAQGTAWRAISVGIEARRMALKKSVRTALLIATRDVDPDPDAAWTALLAIDIKSGWPS